MRRQLFTITCLAVLVLSGAGVRAAESSLVERAFLAWVERAGLTTSDGVLVAQIPCGEKACIQFELPVLHRDRVLVQMVEMAAGFGFGADVERTTMVVDRDNHQEASLTLVVHPERGGPDGDQRMQMASNQVALLRLMATLHEELESPVKMRALPRGTRFYFIHGIAMTQSSSVFDLVAPPGAPAPAPPHRIEGAPGCVCAPNVSAGATRQSGYFVRWQSFKLRCNWVCTPGTKPIE
jgi:hypothetical protein